MITIDVAALQQTTPEILGLSKLSGAFQRLGIISYKDYNDKEVLSWSGWNEGIMDFAEGLEASGGGDYPEGRQNSPHSSDKSGGSQKAKPSPLVCRCTPHHPSQRAVNRHAEVKAIAPGKTDWVSTLL